MHIVTEFLPSSHDVVVRDCDRGILARFSGATAIFQALRWQKVYERAIIDGIVKD